MLGGPHTSGSGGLLGGGSGEKHWRGLLSSPPIPLVTLTLLGVLPAPGHRSALSPRGACTAQLPPRGPSTSPNGRNSSRARDNSKKTSCPFKCPLLPGQTHAPCKRYCPGPHLSRTPFVAVAVPGEERGVREEQHLPTQKCGLVEWGPVSLQGFAEAPEQAARSKICLPVILCQRQQLPPCSHKGQECRPGGPPRRANKECPKA